MTDAPRAALLPLYLELYDRRRPEMRQELEPYLQRLVDGLEAEGLAVRRTGICRTREEVAEAVALAEREEAEALVTVHLAYSPSLEAVEALGATKLPIVVLDTTPDAAFPPTVDPGRILYNHGIHGVQDLTCMLRRRGRTYEVVAGAWEASDVLARAADRVRAVRAAARLRRMKLVRVGRAFGGMGDFAVEPRVLYERFGFELEETSPEALLPYVQSVAEAAVADELAADRERYAGRVDEEAHRRSVRLGLGLRRYLEEQRAGGFSFNFLAFDASRGAVSTVPFLEAAKAMARGVGYAGEGDVLTAGLVGALLAAWPRTTFTEIFCPDWAGDRLFLSHMGEINPAVTDGTARLVEQDFAFTPAQNPVLVAGAPAAGPATLVNLAPGPEESFRLLVAPVSVEPDAGGEAFANKVRGWLRVPGGVAPWLEAYSRLGGTHHSALVLGRRAEAVAAFANHLGLECCRLDGPGAADLSCARNQP
jgi:L-arabinose isomerase